MVLFSYYSSCDDKCIQVKPVRVLLQDILRKSQEGTTADMVAMLPETIVQNSGIKSLESAKKPHSCSLCNKSFAENDTMIIHMQTHTKEKPFTCILCSKSFSLKSNLTRHMRIHTGEKPFSSMICNKLFSQSCEVKSHLQTHTGEKLYSCSQCNKSYAHRCTLKTHMMSHSSKKPYSDMIEGSEVLPQNTVRQDIVPAKVCKCEGLGDQKCENTSLGMMEMVDKQRRHCLAHNCKFKTKQPNSNGKIEHEPKENKVTFACSICMKSFPIYYRLKVHMRKHTKEKPFTCGVCSKPFSQRSHLNVHLRIHRDEKPFSCLICKKVFSQKCNVKIHMRTHSGEKPFSCSYCNKSFTQKISLKEHVLSHTGGTGEKYFCSYCKKSFMWKGSLRKHIMSHTRESFSKCNKSVRAVRGINHCSSQNGQFTSKQC